MSWCLFCKRNISFTQNGSWGDLDFDMPGAHHYYCLHCNARFTWGVRSKNLGDIKPGLPNWYYWEELDYWSIENNDYYIESYRFGPSTHIKHKEWEMGASPERYSRDPQAHHHYLIWEVLKFPFQINPNQITKATLTDKVKLWLLFS